MLKKIVSLPFVLVQPEIISFFLFNFFTRFSQSGICFAFKKLTVQVQQNQRDVKAVEFSLAATQRQVLDDSVVRR